jgi:hypothetical protein
LNEVMHIKCKTRRSGMATMSDSRSTQGADTSATETVDLDDGDAVARAIGLHRAGVAVFAVPFGTMGHGTLTWLDPRTRVTEREQPAQR